MIAEHRIKLLELDHAYWLTHANHYAHKENYEHLFGEAVDRCHSIRYELEDEYKMLPMGGLDRMCFLLEKLSKAIERWAPESGAEENQRGKTKGG